jgi:patatin-like phospholipase/acyl hydrolase
MEADMAKYPILSLDGGGVRGVLTARLLERVEQERPSFLPQVKLFAGTSTGAILAVGLANGLTPTKLVSMYRTHAKDIFHSTPPHQFLTLGSLIGAKYTTQERFNVFQEYFPDVTLGQLQSKVLIVTFQLDSLNPIAPDPSPPRRWQGKFFHNYEGSPYLDQKALDVIMRSSAPPVYFPVYQGFIDGGVIANNPSMCALAQAVNPETGGQNIQDVVLLSLGTGTRPEYLQQTDSNWGVGEWGFKLLDLIFDSGTGLADFHCQQLLGACYSRLNINFGEDQNIGLDAADMTEELISLADACDLGPTLQFIDQQWPLAQ